MTDAGTLPPGVVVLDTNVVSELMKTAPDPSVREWIGVVPPEAAFTTAVTLAEVRYGIARLPHGRRRDLLQAAADDVFDQFADHVLPFDSSAGHLYADLVHEREQVGRPISGFDAQIAAICRSRRASLATRNTGDFAGLALDLIDPWTFSS